MARLAKTLFFATFLTCATCATFFHVASADVGEITGWGSVSASLGGSHVSRGFSGFSGITNPATLSGPWGDNRVRLSYGWTFAAPSFEPIHNVTIENGYVSDNGSTRVGNVSTDYRSTLGQIIGLELPLIPNWKKITLGISTYVPLQNLAYIDTGETYLPEYVLYRARTQRTQLALALGSEISNQVRVGLGTQIGFSATSRANLMIKGTSGEPSSLRFISSLKPVVIPYVGLHWGDDDFSLGLVFQNEAVYQNDLAIEGQAELLSGLTGIPLSLNGQSALFYDPYQLKLGGSIKHSPVARFFFQMELQKWSLYQKPQINLLQSTSQNGISISPSQPLDAEFRDIFVPRVGEEIDLGTTRLRFGYTYHSSILARLPAGAGNILDPSRHSFRLGLGINEPLPLDLHVQWDWMPDENVTKSAGDEAGNAADSKIGSPGYTQGGKIWGAGLSMSWVF